MESYGVARNKPIRREITKPQTTTVIRYEVCLRILNSVVIGQYTINIPEIFQVFTVFWWNKTCHDKFSIIILNVFRFLKKSITKWESLNFFESLFRSFALTARLKQACVYSRDNSDLLAGFAHDQILS